MNASPFLTSLTRGNHLGRLTTCRRCLLARNRLLAQPSRVPVTCVRSLCMSGEDRAQHAGSASAGGLWSRIKFDLGLITGLKYSKSVLSLSGFRMYICCSEMVDYQQFFTEFHMPDTFNSWFLVTDLHVWLCMVRLATLGKDGRLLRNCLAKALWEDVESRSKHLGSAASLTARKEGVRQLADLFHASLFAYDEGLLGDDKALAGAVWRIFFEMCQHLDPAHLELMVAYIRKQVAHIDQQEEDSILGRGFITFLPLTGEILDQNAAQRKALTLDRLRTKF